LFIQSSILPAFQCISGKRQIEGTAQSKEYGNSFTSEEFASCSIMIKFIGQGMIAVLQESEPTDCGFGRKDLTTGNYRKISGAKPKFKDEILNAEKRDECNSITGHEYKSTFYKQKV
jgi:hypothetical protein